MQHRVVTNFSEHFLEQDFKENFQAGVWRIIGFKVRVDTTSSKESFALFNVFARRIDGERMAAILSCDRHRRNIGVPIPDVDHIAKRNRAITLRHVIVDGQRQVLNTLIYPKEILSFRDVCDYPVDESWPAKSIVVILRSEYCVKVSRNRDAFKNFL